MKYEKQRIDSAALHRISCSCVGSLSSVALFCCIFSFGTFFGIIRVYTVVFSDPIKWNRSYIRARRRGIKSLFLEFGMISCGFNLHKFHLKKVALRSAA